MQKNLKLKLEHLSRDKLLELLEELSNVPEVQKIIKAMVIDAPPPLAKHIFNTSH